MNGNPILKKGIMKARLIFKFSKNTNCFKALELTEKHRLVDTSPRYTVWGVGLSIKDDNIGNVNYWKGYNC